MIKIEKDEDLILKHRTVSINGNEVGIIYLKNNEWMFFPSEQDTMFATYEVINFEVMLKYGTISKSDLNLMKFCDTVEEAFSYLTRELTRLYL